MENSIQESTEIIKNALQHQFDCIQRMIDDVGTNAGEDVRDALHARKMAVFKTLNAIKRGKFQIAMYCDITTNQTKISTKDNHVMDSFRYITGNIRNTLSDQSIKNHDL